MTDFCSGVSWRDDLLVVRGRAGARPSRGRHRRGARDGYRRSTTGFEAVAEEAAAEGVEFEFGEDGPERRLVAGTDAEHLGLEGERDVDVDGGEAFREDRLVAEFLERFAELPFLLGGVVERVFQRVVLRDEF